MPGHSELPVLMIAVAAAHPRRPRAREKPIVPSSYAVPTTLSCTLAYRSGR